MSRRNSRTEKKLATLRRVLRKGRIPAYIDLVEWLKVRGHADTTGGAMRLLKEGRVKSESHPLGVQIVELEDGSKVRIANRYVPASLRPTIVFVEG